MNRPVCMLFGAGEGLGRALAAKFAAGGMDMALLSRSAAGSEAALKAARAAAPEANVQFFQCDARDPQAIETAVAGVTADMGDVEVLIYNAFGGYNLRAPLEMSYEELDDIFRTEVIGAFAAAKAVMPGMIGRERGTVLFSSATAAFRGSATNPIYAIGKFGLRGLSQSLAKAYAKNGVHVVHVRLDCMLDVPSYRDALGDEFDKAATADCDDVAESYWWAHRQPKSAWSNEIELRPYTEVWTY